MLLYHINFLSKGKQVHRVCHLQAEDLSKHRLFYTRDQDKGDGRLAVKRSTKFTYNSKGVF